MDTYEITEISRFRKELTETEKSSLADRKAGKADLIEMLTTDLAQWEKRVEFLLDGDYGYGALASYNRCTKRMNRRAWLFNHIAVIEYKTSFKYACDVWHGLDTDLQASINVILDELIKEHDAKREEE